MWNWEGMNLDDLDKVILKYKSDPERSHYFQIGENRIRESVNQARDLIKDGDKVLDIGGSLIFKECFATIERDFDYQFTNRGKGDLRIESLDYPDESFDMVMSHETIEHMYQLEGEGMLNTEGLINFWTEGYRLLKPGGYFLVSTRNRNCPSSWDKLHQGMPPMQSFYFCSTHIHCHAQELSGTDYRELSKITGLFTNHSIYSTPSRPSKPAWADRMSAFLGRPLKQEELHDTIWFKSTK